MQAKQLQQQFSDRFGTAPTLIVRSPGRINLIGEHTDYNNGWVLPASIDKAIWFVAAPSSEPIIEVFAADLNDADRIEISTPPEKLAKSWPNYLRGIVAQLQLGNAKLGGARILMTGDIPLGAGLSSSAAVECGFALVLDQLFNLGLSKKEIALMGQRSENQFVGVNCGIMDQFASVFGKNGKVIRLDCRTLDYEYFPFDYADINIVLCDTGVKHSLGDSEYNTRRAQCEEGVRVLSAFLPGIRSLRDVSVEQFEQHSHSLSSIVNSRCRYVVYEIRRVEEACQDLNQNDLEAFGKKMFETHHGLQYDYEVSCPELDFLVDFASSQPGVIGSRMMGGGFGGCTINLVKKSFTDAFVKAIAPAYLKSFGVELKAYITQIEDGASVVPLQ